MDKIFKELDIRKDDVIRYIGDSHDVYFLESKGALAYELATFAFLYSYLTRKSITDFVFAPITPQGNKYWFYKTKEILKKTKQYLED